MSCVTNSCVTKNIHSCVTNSCVATIARVDSTAVHQVSSSRQNVFLLCSFMLLCFLYEIINFIRSLMYYSPNFILKWLHACMHLDVVTCKLCSVSLLKLYCKLYSAIAEQYFVDGVLFFPMSRTGGGAFIKRAESMKRCWPKSM